MLQQALRRSENASAGGMAGGREDGRLDAAPALHCSFVFCISVFLLRTKIVRVGLGKFSAQRIAISFANAWNCTPYGSP